jgi:hypothetical protein
VYVKGTGSPATAATVSKVVFSDAGGFDTLGWAPEGQVFFQYAVAYATATPSAYTISATANIDGDAASQSWGYVKPIGTTTTGIGGAGACATTGVWDPSLATPAKKALNTVGPCDGTSGQSVF